jgi:hypothetical protein
MIPDDPIPDTEPAPDLAPHIALDYVSAKLGPGEQRVLARVAERRVHGMTVYVPLDLANDIRDFRRREAREQLEDVLVDLVCAWLQAEEVAA